MTEVTEYTFYQDCALTIRVVNMRPEAAPANVLVAGTLFTEYAAKVADALSEYKVNAQYGALVPVAKQLSTHLPQSGGFPLYGIRRIQPSGQTQEVDNDYQQDILNMRFAVDFSILPTAWQQNPALVKAFARNIQRAVKLLLDANSIPSLTIPGDDEVLGESYISITLDVGVAGEISSIQVAA